MEILCNYSKKIPKSWKWKCCVENFRNPEFCNCCANSFPKTIQNLWKWKFFKISEITFTKFVLRINMILEWFCNSIPKFFYQHFSASWIGIPEILCICWTCGLSRLSENIGPQWMNWGLTGWSIIHFPSYSINCSELIFTNLYFQTL